MLPRLVDQTQHGSAACSVANTGGSGWLYSSVPLAVLRSITARMVILARLIGPRSPLTARPSGGGASLPRRPGTSLSGCIPSSCHHQARPRRKLLEQRVTLAGVGVGGEGAGARVVAHAPLLVQAAISEVERATPYHHLQSSKGVV